jgi:predicted esterase
MKPHDDSTAREHRIETKRSARYYTLGPDAASTSELWFVIHGYGQLAAQFIRVFDAIDDGTRRVVAPEALNRFYLIAADSAPALDRPVGATWMTREDREHEIEDYIAYLDRVASKELERVAAHAVPPRLIVLGFSQGTATVGRWITRGAIRPAHVVAWGGFLPPEIDLSGPGQPLRTSSLHVLIGDRDRFTSADRVVDEEQRLRSAGVPHELIRYPGGHGISRDRLVELARSLATSA